MRRGSFALLCHAALGSRDGGQALTRVAGFLRLVLDDLRCEIDADTTRVRIRLVDTAAETRSPRPMFAYATAFIMIYGLLCWLVGRRIPVLAAHLRCPEPAATDEYRLMFCDAMFFDQTESSCRSRAGLRHVAGRSDGRYAEGFPARGAGQLHREISQSRFTRCADSPQVAAGAPIDWPDSEDIAAALNMAEATLRRRLKQEGATYQSIRDALRRDLAIARLADTTQTIAEIAHALGFAEPSAFHRAFRKWTGVRPAAYRGMRADTDTDTDIDV